MVTVPLTVSADEPACVKELFVALPVKVNEAALLLLFIVTVAPLPITRSPNVVLDVPLIDWVVPEKVTELVPLVYAPLFVQLAPAPFSVRSKLLPEALNVPCEISTLPDKVVLALKETVFALSIVRFAGVFCVRPFPTTWLHCHYKYSLSHLYRFLCP